MACSFCDRLFSDIRRHKQASRKKKPRKTNVFRDSAF